MSDKERITALEEIIEAAERRINEEFISDLLSVWAVEG